MVRSDKKPKPSAVPTYASSSRSRTAYALWERYRKTHDRQWFRSISSMIRVDIRLLLTALILWIFTFTALQSGTFLPYKFCVLAAIALLGILVLILNTHLGHRFAAIICPVLGQLMFIMLVVTLQAALLIISGTDSSRTTLRDAEGTSLRITGTIREIRPLDSHTEVTIIKAESAQYRSLQAPLHEDIRIYTGTQKSAEDHKQRLTTGMRVRVLGTLENKGTAATLKGASIFPLQDGENAAYPSENMLDLRTRMREYTRSYLGDSEATALLLGTAYGDDSAMPAAAKENYKLSGLSHLTAVSGANIAIIFMLGYRLGLKLRVPRRAIILMGLASVALYSMILTFEGSVIRSLLMGTLGAFAMIRGTGRNTFSALASTLILCLLADPHLAGDLGFGLSAIATASLILLGPSLTRLLARYLPFTLSELVAASASASLWCTPMILALSGNIPLYSVPANMLVAPLTSLTMFAGLMAFISYSAGLTAFTNLALTLGKLPAQGIEYFAKLFAHAPSNPLTLEVTPAVLGITTLIVFILSLSLWIGDYRTYRQELHLMHARNTPPYSPRLRVPDKGTG